MRSRNRSAIRIGIGGSALTLLLLSAQGAKADLCDQGEDTLITHQLYHGRKATIITCPSMYADEPPAPRHKTSPVVKTHKVAPEPLRRPARRVHRSRRQKGFLDALASIFRPRR